MADQFGIQGAQEPNDSQGEFNAISFLISQMIARLNVSGVVKVIAVNDPGGTAAAGTVDVQPMVNQLDGSLNMVEHGVIFSLPYMRLQGGANAFVVVPKVGDLGIALYADRDISAVKAARGQANPGSLRRFDMADGMYLGGMLNGAPTRYVRIDDSGVTIEGVAAVTVHGNTTTINATNAVINATDLKANVTTAEVNASSSATVTSPDIECVGNTKVTGTFTVTGNTSLQAALAVTGAATLSATLGVTGATALSAGLAVAGGAALNGGFTATGGGGSAGTITGSLTVTGDVTANGTSVHTHEHSGVQPGVGTSGPPV